MIYFFVSLDFFIWYFFLVSEWGGVSRKSFKQLVKMDIGQRGQGGFLVCFSMVFLIDMRYHLFFEILLQRVKSEG